MNVSVTNACNRRCEYCFQKDWYLAKKATPGPGSGVVEMSPEEFDRLCQWAVDRSHIKLMGGEPLLHSHLPSLIEVARKYGKTISFISNISIDPAGFKGLLREFDKNEGTVRGFLVNTDYPAAQEADFKENLEYLFKNQPYLPALSTTLLPDLEETRKAVQRIKELGEIYKSINGNDIANLRVRVSPYAPNPRDFVQYEICDFTDIALELLKSLSDYGLRSVNFDCPVNCCEIWGEMLDEIRRAGTVQIRTRACAPNAGMPFDVLVDHSVIWCSSASFIRLSDWREYQNVIEARSALEEKYYKWWNEHDENANCSACKERVCKRCSGLCIAKTYALEKSHKAIQINGIRW